MQKTILHIFQLIRQHFELLCWTGALLALFFLSETKSETSLCVFTAVGFGHCPGCGIGHAIHFALRGQLVESFNHHPLGIFAVLIIFNRARILLKQKNKHEQQLF